MIYSKDNTIALRAVEKSDLPLLQKWRNNQSFRQYFREYREFSMTQKENWYNEMIKDNKNEFFMIVDCINNIDVGIAGLTYIDWVNRHADVHFYIGNDDAWIDDNYAPRAFDLVLRYGYHDLNLNKLWAELYEIDIHKIKFFQSFGFKVDASLREHYFHKGKYYTSHILSLLRSEVE